MITNNGDKDDEDGISFLISTAYARSSSIDFLVFDMNQKQIAILWIREVVQRKGSDALWKKPYFFRFSLDSFSQITCCNLNPWESGNIYLFPNSHVICNRWHPVGEWLKVVGCVRTSGRNFVWQKTSFKGELRLPRTWSRNLMLKVWLWDDDFFLYMSSKSWSYSIQRCQGRRVSEVPFQIVEAFWVWGL